MRAAFISTILHYPWGGPDKRWTALAEVCRSRGDDVMLAISPLTADHPRVRQLEAAGAKVWLRRRTTAYRGRLEAMERHLPLLRKRHIEPALQAFRPDVIFLLQGATYDMLGEPHLAAWIKQSSVPCVVSCSLNSDDVRISAAQVAEMRGFFERAAAVLFMSAANRKLAEQQLGSKIGRGMVIQNPVELEFPAETPEAPRGDRIQLGFVGRVDVRHKGLDILLEALASADSRKEVELHLTGRSEQASELNALVQRFGLEGRVHLHGAASGDSLRKAYTDSELICLTSRHEGCASTMLEAMMASRPLLATPVGGVGDWLTDGVDSFVASNTTVGAVTQALRRALDNRERWPAMGRAARSAFESRRDPDPLATLVGILDRATGRRAA